MKKKPIKHSSGLLGIARGAPIAGNPFSGAGGRDRGAIEAYQEASLNWREMTLKNQPEWTSSLSRNMLKPVGGFSRCRRTA